MPYKECMATLTDIGTEEDAHGRWTQRKTLILREKSELSHPGEDLQGETVRIAPTAAGRLGILHMVDDFF